MSEVEAIFACLKGRRLPLNNEIATQDAIASAFKESGISYQREVRLDAANRIDFMVGDIGCEVKIKSPKMKLFKQVERYAEFDAISRIVLIINVATGFPKEVNGKPVYVLNLAKAWL